MCFAECLHAWIVVETEAVLLGTQSNLEVEAVWRCVLLNVFMLGL